MKRALAWAAVAALSPLWSPCALGAAVHHDIEALLDPPRHAIEVADTVTVDGGSLPGRRALTAVVHADLEILELAGDGVEVSSGGLLGRAHPRYSGLVPLRELTLRPTGSAWPERFTLRFKAAGRIHHPLRSQSENYARSFQETPGTITEEGAYLSKSSAYLPWLPFATATFTLKARLPPGWDAVSQGGRILHERTAQGTTVVWDCPQEADDAYLVAGAFTERQARLSGGVEAYAFLRSDDPALARKYLDATALYLDLYRELIGPYPYAKFALVENFWETGYGMPSFTLLGPSIIRLPFIVRTSFPHEILHNWWGNGVFVDYGRGNWCEGLTAYLADHLLEEAQGRGGEHRKAALERYRNFVRAGRDFPVASFTERRSSASEAIGYGKTEMVYHMLRRMLGDEAFKAGLRGLYKGNIFKTIGFAEVQAAFEASAGRSLEGFFKDWVRRPGAPDIELTRAAALEPAPGSGGGGFGVRLSISQVQAGRAFSLRLPVAVVYDKEGSPATTVVEAGLDRKRQDLTLRLPGRPLAVQLDPAFDVFRRLDRMELPPTVGQALGDEKVLVVLPSAEPDQGLARAYGLLAEGWRKEGPGKVSVITDAKFPAPLPRGRSAWVVGRRNRYRERVLESLAEHGVRAGADALAVGGLRIPFQDRSVALVGRSRSDPERAWAWLFTDRPRAVAGLGRKLAHYGKYSFLAFEGDEPANVEKGSWPSRSGRLYRRLGPADPPIETAAAEPLARPKPLFSAERMAKTVAFLASERLEGRGLPGPGLDEAARFIAERFREAGLKPWTPGAAGPASPGAYFQSWRAKVPGAGEIMLSNVVGVAAGTDPAFEGQSVVLGAHYDHLGRGGPDARKGDEGAVHPGADDNASGVAVLLELAAALGKTPPGRTVVFAAFTGEEAGRLGSKRFVSDPGPYPLSRMAAMVNLDSVGRLGDRKLLALGTGSSRAMPHIVMGAGFVTGLETERVAGDPGGSDQVSFLEKGVPAIQLFTGPHLDYHRPGDRPEKLDYEGMARVAAFAKEVADYLASTDSVPVFSGDAVPAAGAAAGGAFPARGKGAGPRKASLGTVPDFSHPGPGVKLEGVAPGSPAESAGLRRGDVLLELDGRPLKGLADLSAALSARRPGDTVSVAYRRDESPADGRGDLSLRRVSLTLVPR